MKYYLIKSPTELKAPAEINVNDKENLVELTVEDLKAIGYSITNTCEVFGDKLPSVVSKIRKVLE